MTQQTGPIKRFSLSARDRERARVLKARLERTRPSLIEFYSTRLATVASIEQFTDYADGFNLYGMDIRYAYDLDRLIDAGITDDQSVVDAITSEALPYLPVNIEAPSFGCSAFKLRTCDGSWLMGRNYDFSINTSAMLVRCHPEGAYASLAFAALANVSANDPLAGPVEGLAALTAPFMCLDGINEKGVSIAVLTLDSDPVRQSTGKKKIATSIAIRAVLDRAATTQEAVELLEGFDMVAPFGRDYHFYISDADGDGRVVEYDCDDPARPLAATPMDAITNFYALYADRVNPGERNRYGHGKDRYEAVLETLDAQRGGWTARTAWDALEAAAQDFVPGDATSNTQWSVVYDNAACTADCTIRRHWGDVRRFELGAEAPSR